VSGYRLSGAADRDIGLIASRGIEMFGVAQARAYHTAIFDLFGLLADTPRLGRERFDLSPPVRVHPYRSHVVIYRIEDDGHVLVLRVRHGREDWLDAPA
jgi:toxin ParE1/3/4